MQYINVYTVHILQLLTHAGQTDKEVDRKKHTHNTHKWRENFLGPLSHALIIKTVQVHA